MGFSSLFQYYLRYHSHGQVSCTTCSWFTVQDTTDIHDLGQWFIARCRAVILTYINSLHSILASFCILKPTISIKHSLMKITYLTLYVMFSCHFIIIQFYKVMFVFLHLQVAFRSYKQRTMVCIIHVYIFTVRSLLL